MRLKNSQPELLYLTFFERGVSINDTFQKKDNGYYYLSSKKIKSPQVTMISSSSLTIKDIFVAPGYDLLISGDASDDFYQLKKNIQISGIGQNANLYSHMRDSLWETRPIKGLSPYEKNEKTFLNSLTEMRLLTDTLLRKYLLLDAHDSTHLFFVNLKKIDNKYDQLGYLLGFAKNFNEDYKYSKQILKDYAHFDLSKDLNDSLLVSESFRSFITYHYINFIVNQKNQTDSRKPNQLFTRFDVANKIYSGDIKQYALSSILDNIVSSITNIDELMSIKNDFFQRVNYLSSNAAKKELIHYYNFREIELNAFVVGKDAPIFSGNDINGKHCNSRQLISKVLYIDLWATWCGACLRENIHLEELYQNYKDNPNFSIISIAIADHLPRWKSFLQNENQNSHWAQWFDMGSKTGDLFKGTLELPKFIIIDKNGKITDFNAPPPSENDQLKTILDKLLNRSVVK